MDHLYINKYNRSDTYYVYVKDPNVNFYNFTQYSKWKRSIELLAPMRITGHRIHSKKALRLLFDNVGEAAAFIRRLMKYEKNTECDIQMVEKTFIIG